MINIENSIKALDRSTADMEANRYRHTRVWTIVLLLLFLLSLPLQATADAVFKSGFETGVTMSDFIPGSKWSKRISGSDKGYDWATDLPGGSSNYWNLILDAGRYPDPSECLDLDISSNQSKSGSRSLRMKIHGQCTNNGVNARVSYLPAMGKWPYDETHMKYWLKLPPSFATNLKADAKSGTANFSEMRMGSSDLRIIFDIVTVEGGNLKFRIWAEDITSGWNPHWIHTSDEPVPINEWFHVELYHHAKTYAEGGGAHWIKINGKKILEVIPTKSKRICGKSTSSATCENPSDWNIIKLYTWEKQPIEVYLDDFEIYDTLTPTSGEVIQRPDAPTLRVVEQPSGGGSG